MGDLLIAIVVGVAGQDGLLLKQNLENQGYEVVGVTRKAVVRKNREESFSISRLEEVERLVYSIQPSEVYYLAAHHTSSERDNTSNHPENYLPFHQVHVEGFLNFYGQYTATQSTAKFFMRHRLLYSMVAMDPVKQRQPPLVRLVFMDLLKCRGYIYVGSSGISTVFMHRQAYCIAMNRYFGRIIFYLKN